MINESLIKRYNIGKDGFSWWLGQVCESETWLENYPVIPVDKQDDLPGFKRRVKVSILGWHTSSKEELKNDELPWAYCLLPVTAGGGGGGASESLNLQGGEWVFGFFLDGEDGQQPVIIGVLDKSTQEDYRDDIKKQPRYTPFSGFTNKRVVPLTDTKKDEAQQKTAVGNADVKVGNTGVKRTKTQPVSTVRIEPGCKEDIRPKASKTRYSNGVATGDMQIADPSDCNDPLAICDKAMKRLSKLQKLNEEYDGYQIDKGRNIFSNIKEEEKRAAEIVASAQTVMQEKVRGATLEAASKSMSNVATFSPISGMFKAKLANDKAASKIIDSFNKVIDKLPSDAMGFVSGAGKKLVSQPPCVAEDYVGALMGKTLGSLDSQMNGLMGDVNTVLAGVDKLGSLAKMGMGGAGSMGSMLSQGLNAFGGISIGLDGITKFATSYKKLMKGEKPLPCPPGKDFTLLGGAMPDAPGNTKLGNVLGSMAANVAGMGQLNAGVSNLLDKNSLFSTAVNLDNNRLGDLGGLGGVIDTLGKAKNLSSFKDLPGTTGDSVLQATQNILEGGETIDAALVAADVIYPGAGSIVKSAFGNQLKGLRGGGGSSCETGPTSNGPPICKIFGGNGNGATANPVIGPNGNLLAVQITRGGKGFTDVPYVVITDSSGNGKGAVVKAQVGAGGTLSDISVVHAGYGYTGAPDGGVGGNGMNFANADNTMLKDKEGNYYNFEPGTGIVIPPGGIVYLPVGSKAQLPTSTVKTNGEPLVAPSGSNIINYAAIRLMHNFDTSKGNIIPGKQGSEGEGKPGFGRGIDYKRAKEEGYSDSDIRFFLEGNRTTGVPGYFVNNMNGAIGQNMQKLLDDPRWGQLPVMNSGGKNPGKIKSLQIQWKKGYKGFAKVTDGSRLGAGPVTGLRDAVTDRKISNILEFQTGNWLNVQADLDGNTDIMELFKQAELRSIEGTEIEGYGKFGTAGKRTWEQTRQSVSSGFDSNISGGGQRKNIIGENYRTLDPWRADLKAGTRLTFRGAYNHNTALSAEQLQDPYNLQKNNYRYFVYDWVVEVYDTPFSYSYAQGVDTVKKKWYKLVDIKLVTATEDWFNGETVVKRCRDKAGRLYEMYIKICTYDDSTAEAIGYGLATSSEGQQVIKTPLPCNPPKKSDKWADYQPVRWWREMQGEKKMVSEAYGHIPGTERNTLVREIVEVYNEIGNKNKIRFTDYHNAVPYKKARQYVDQEGLNHWVKEYFIQLELVRKGLSSELEEGTESKPLSEAEYTSYKDNLNQKPEPTAFASMKKLIWAGFKEAARKQGPIVKEETYCDWAREYVDEVQDTFRPTTTIGYELPCGGEITAPYPTGEKPPTGGSPIILVPKTVEIPCTGMGYTSGDTLSIGGVVTPFDTDPDGRIINIDVPKLGPQLDYPIVEINTNTGAGADIEVTLEAIPVTSEMDVLPTDIVEVIDCVGKNIFIKES